MGPSKGRGEKEEARGFVAIVVLSVLIVACRVPPDEAMQNFYANDGPECTLTDPLWDGGAQVVPLVVTAIADRTMPRRRYAIGFLGEFGDRRAMDVLTRIASDRDEDSLFRADALKALARIDSEQAHQLAGSMRNPEGLLAEYVDQIRTGPGFRRPTRYERAWKCF